MRPTEHFSVLEGQCAVAMGEPNDRSFDDLARGHPFDVFKLSKHIADLRLERCISKPSPPFSSPEMPR